MNILLYSPDNGVTRRFMLHSWTFFLKSLTPPQHDIFCDDGSDPQDLRLIAGVRREVA